MNTPAIRGADFDTYKASRAQLYYGKGIRQLHDIQHEANYVGSMRESSVDSNGTLTLNA